MGQNITLACRACLQGWVRAGRCSARVQSHFQWLESANAWRDCPSGTSWARWQPEEVQLQVITLAWKACLRGCVQESGARSTRKVRLQPSWWEAALAWRSCSRSKVRARWKPEEVQFQPPEKEEAGSGILTRGVQRHHRGKERQDRSGQSHPIGNHKTFVIESPGPRMAQRAIIRVTRPEIKEDETLRRLYPLWNGLYSDCVDQQGSPGEGNS